MVLSGIPTRGILILGFIYPGISLIIMLIRARYSKTLNSHKMQLDANANFEAGDSRLIQTTRQSSTEKGTHVLSALDL
jgi:hypothetical protein